jgi:F-type H+-transporting ATPase subunit epsilon
MTASSLHCTLATPHECLFEGAVWQVTIPGRSGGFGIRTGHAPILAPIAGGVAEIAVTGTERYRYMLKGGILEHSGNDCTIIVESAGRVEEPLEPLQT